MPNTTEMEMAHAQPQAQSALSVDDLPDPERNAVRGKPNRSLAGLSPDGVLSEDQTPPASQKKRKPAAPISENSAAGSDDAAPGDEIPGDDRLRADQLMVRAHQSYREGYATEALRLASLAAELEKSNRAEYHNGEERPSDFIAWLQRADAKPNAHKAHREDDSVSTNAAAGSSDHSASDTKPAHRRSRDVLRETGVMILQAPQRDKDLEPEENSEAAAGEEVSKGGPRRYRRSQQPIALAADPEALAAMQALAAGRQDSLAGGPDSIDPRIAAAGFTEAPPAPEDEDPAALAGRAETERMGVDTLTDRNVAAGQSEIFDESEGPASMDGRPTPLTWFGVVGLLSGLAGMIGLKWWHVQERRYFAVTAPHRKAA
jgi:hypothetical protein